MSQYWTTLSFHVVIDRERQNKNKLQIWVKKARAGRAERVHVMIVFGN